MSTSTFDPSKLQAFGNAAAGHDGVLSDSTGAVVIKPCTPAEIAFYESLSSHPDLAPHLPTFMGTLSLTPSSTGTAAVDHGTIVTATGATERLHGKKLDTELHIVLENITAGFKKPNVLDLKLGAQLWDEGAKPEKRARLDAVSDATTSRSMGFRIAGMRTFQGGTVPEVPGDLGGFVESDKEGGYWVYNKMYGRKFNAQNVREGFEAYVFPGEERSAAAVQRAKEVLAYFLSEVQDIQKVFEGKESRMYGASILLVYEGDLEEYEQTRKRLADAQLESEDIEEDEDNEVPQPKLATVKMIDFAHATWQPGKGPDENALRGMRSAVQILQELLKETEAN